MMIWHHRSVSGIKKDIADYEDQYRRAQEALERYQSPPQFVQRRYDLMQSAEEALTRLRRELADAERAGGGTP